MDMIILTVMLVVNTFYENPRLFGLKEIVGTPVNTFTKAHGDSNFALDIEYL